MKHDRYGNKISTSSQQAADAYIEGVDFFLSAQPGGIDAFKRAISADAEFALAHAGLARTLQSLAQMDEASAAMDRATELNQDLSTREQAHISIIGNLISGNSAPAYLEILEHIREYPRDVLTVQPCCGVFSLIGFSGKPGREAEHLAFTSALASSYGDDWWFESQFAFAQCEVGQLDRAGKTIERAFAANTSNANAVHVSAHVHYECGDAVAGKAFLSNWLKNYNQAGQLHCHLNWHAALWELETGSIEQAWQIIINGVHPDTAWGPPINVLSDLVSFLLRAEYLGQPRRHDLWADASSYASTFYSSPGVSFADAHAAIAHAIAGDEAALAKLEQDPTGSAGDQVQVLAGVYSALVRSQWQQVIDRLTPIMSSHERLGGSRAQRDLLEFTLVNALLKLGEGDEASRFLATRRPRIATDNLFTG
jgi:Tfp pilus assembly protein PilF